MYYLSPFNIYWCCLADQQQGIVLAKYLERTHKENPKDLENKKFLELGSGTGLLGITVGLLGTRSSFFVNLFRLSNHLY